MSSTQITLQDANTLVDILNKEGGLGENDRKPFSSSGDQAGFTLIQSPNPAWKPGDGANNDEWKKHKVVGIDPYDPNRTPLQNYRLAISGFTPRPIGFLSTLDAAGNANLAPYSYFGLFCSDPPTFVVSPNSSPRNSLDNILAIGECTVNITSDWFAEAANYTSIAAPSGVSEWVLTGLTKGATKVVKPARVAEAALSVECKLVHHYEITSPTTGKRSATICILQGVYYHVREDVMDPETNRLKTELLRPISRLGGITYGAVKEGFELPRPQWHKEIEREEVKALLEKAENDKETGLNK